MNKPIFVHSGWRTGSTYIWSKFRLHSDCMPFYEPFNEVLVHITHDMLPSFQPSNWDSHHPRVATSYFSEYGSLISTGVQGFHPNFTIKNFFRNEQECLWDQAAYLAMLMHLSYQSHRRPVFNFCRSLGRIPWLRQTFPGIHILLLRNPIDQWLSGRAQLRKGNPYFEIMPYLIMGQDEVPPIIRNIAQYWKLPQYTSNIAFFDAYHQIRPLVTSYSTTQSFGIFLDLYLYSTLLALPFVDIVIDMDELDLSLTYRQEVSNILRETLNLSLPFDDVHITHYGPDNRPPHWQNVIINALQRMESQWLPEMYCSIPELQPEHVNYIIHKVREVPLLEPRIRW